MPLEFVLGQQSRVHFRRFFTKLWEEPIRFISVCPSIAPYGKPHLRIDKFSWKVIFEYFLKICRENSSFIKIWQEWRVLYMKTDIRFWSYLTNFFLEWEMFQAKLVETIKTHILWSIFLFRISCCLWHNVGKYCTAGQATDTIIRRMRIARCIPKATNTHSEYVIPIASPLQQWLHERSSVCRRHTDIACLAPQTLILP
jgi:hypothetical protein